MASAGKLTFSKSCLEFCNFGRARGGGPDAGSGAS